MPGVRFPELDDKMVPYPAPSCCDDNYRTGSCDCIIPVDKFIRGDRPKYNLSYRCPWCNHITNDKVKARYHSLVCKKTKSIIIDNNLLSNRELREIAKKE